MKRLSILSTVLLSASIFSANALQLGVGFDGGIGFYSSNYDSEASSMEETETSKRIRSLKNFQLVPYFAIMPNDLIELTAGLGIGMYGDRRESSENDSLTSYSEDSEFYIGPQLGALFHIIRTEHFHLSMGPEVGLAFGTEPVEKELNEDGKIEEVEFDYAEYNRILFGISIPLKCDLYVTENLAFRIGLDLMGFSVDRTTSTISNDALGEGNDTEREMYFTFLGNTFNGWGIGGIVLPNVGVAFYF